MTYDEYQKAAHSTAVYGDNNSYPFMAVAEEAGEVVDVWKNLIEEGKPQHPLTMDVLDKLCDEIGDVCWNVAELMTILNRSLQASSDKVVSGKQDSPSNYWLCRIVHRVGTIQGIYAKWTRKHNGVQPTNEELINQTAVVDHVEDLWALVRIFIISVGLSVDDVLEHNISKLAARKANNTLGGAGSVARKE